MEWEKIDKVIQRLVSEIKDKCIIKNAAIRDNIFDILEDNCTVIYYHKFLQQHMNLDTFLKSLIKSGG